FNGTNGRSPSAPLIQGSDGAFYGTTQSGGLSNYGTIFRLATNGALTTLYSFTGATDGAYPLSGLVQAPDGFLYGTASERGSNNFGSAFKLTTNGVFTKLVSFNNNNGASPRSALLPLVDNNGNFFGTTHQGANGAGAVFKMAPSGSVFFVSPFNFTNG